MATAINFYFSIPSQDFILLDIIRESLIHEPEDKRPYLPEELRKAHRNIFSKMLNDLAYELLSSKCPICVDPENGHITIDQIRLYAYENFYNNREREVREGLVKAFIENTPKEYKDFAQNTIKDLDWDNDDAFRDAMEALLVEYEARSLYDIKTYPCYGFLFQGNYMGSITRQGIKHSVDCETIEGKELPHYFTDRKYLKGHMEKVHKRHDEFVNSNEPSKTHEIEKENLLKDNYLFYSAVNNDYSHDR